MPPDEFVENIARRFELRPTPRAWILHIALLLLTVITATIAGTLIPFGPLPIFPDANPQTFLEVIGFVLSLPIRYVLLIYSTIQSLLHFPDLLRASLSFSLSLVFILLCHELGHYIACRIYRVDATLPYFIPAPPMMGPAGTLGAFIKIISRLPSRRATFDIGVAGPIAGFIALIPIAVYGVLTMDVIPADAIGEPFLILGDPLLMKVIAYFADIPLERAVINPFYSASWIGLLVTSLNLIPSGQLDGGHAIYAVFGERFHDLTGKFAFAAMAALSVYGMIYYGSPGGILFVVILLIMMRIGHPRPLDETPLDLKRKLIALLTLLIFALCFVPFPFQIPK